MFVDIFVFSMKVVNNLMEELESESTNRFGEGWGGTSGNVQGECHDDCTISRCAVAAVAVAALVALGASLGMGINVLSRNIVNGVDKQW